MITARLRAYAKRFMSLLSPLDVQSNLQRGTQKDYSVFSFVFELRRTDASASSSLISWLRKNVVASFQLANRRIEALGQAGSLSPHFSVEDALVIQVKIDLKSAESRAQLAESTH
jgi:ABC-type uncharacterized transport system YnjBCD ATPase subunit